MVERGSWPELAWTVPTDEPMRWLRERVHEIAVRTRAFEFGVEKAAEGRDVALAAAIDELESWEKISAWVWLYLGFTAAQMLSELAAPFHAQELEKIYRGLSEVRDAVLVRVGAQASARLRARELTAEVDEKSLIARVGPLPSANILEERKPDLGAGRDAPPAAAPAQPPKPVTPSELRLREAAESKPLPDRCDLATLLARLPTEWVDAVFRSLGITAEVSDGGSSRATALRTQIQDHLGRPENLARIVRQLDDADRALLGELAARGALPLADVTSRHGTAEADGFYWGDRPPSGPLGRLRRYGLAYVGARASRRVVALPTDLVEPLRAALERAAAAGAPPATS